jgi:Ni,Fe-hydrogenase III large subunit
MLRIIVNDLELIEDHINKYKGVLKFLHVVLCKYNLMFMAIEQVVNLLQLMIEELCGRLLKQSKATILKMPPTASTSSPPRRRSGMLGAKGPWRW